MKKLLLVILFTAMGMGEGLAQTLVQTYVDRCTGEVKVMTVQMNSNTVVTYYNRSRTFSATDFQNGTLQSWLEETYLWWNSLSPCSTTTTGANATQQTTQQTTQQAATAASNAVATTANTTANAAPTTTTTPPPTQTSQSTTQNTTSPDTTSSQQNPTTSGQSTTGKGDSTSTSGGTGTDSSNQQSNSSTDQTSSNESGSTEGTTQETSSSESQDTTGGDTGNEESTEVDNTTEDTSTEENTTEETSSEENSEETSNEETDESTDEETTEESSEEETDESTEEDSEEESSEEESTEEEDEDTENEDSEEKENNEGDEKDEKKKKKKRNLAPPIVTANILSQQLPTGGYSQAANVGISQSSLMGDKTYGLNLMIYDNLQQSMLNINYSKVNINNQGRVNRVYSGSLGIMKSYSTYVAMMNHSLVFMGKKGSVAGLAFGTTLTSVEVDVRGGQVLVDQLLLGTSLTTFWTKPFNFERLTVSPMIAISSPFMQFDMYQHNVYWNQDVMFIGGVNFTYTLTKRFGVNIGTNFIESTSPEFKIMKTFTIGGRLNF